MRLLNYEKPTSLSEAYELYNATKDSVVIAGGAYARLQERTISLGIDLEKLKLDTIDITIDQVSIGSMVTLRVLETHKQLNQEMNAVFKKATQQIGGVQLRNIATIGGSICGRYPFSDIIPPLLAMDAQLYFFDSGIISLEEYLEEPFERDILTKIVINKNQLCSFQCFKKTYKEFSVLNVALNRKGDYWKLVVGARPGRAMVARETSKYLKNNDSIDEIYEILRNEIPLGSNFRGGKKFRQILMKELFGKAYQEVVKYGSNT